MAANSFDADLSKLPQAFRGYSRFETEELFKRLAWEYAVLAGEHRELKKTVEALEPSTQSQSELDEQAHDLLNAARKVVREMRETARADSEQAIKKARARAAEIEADAQRAAADAASVLEAAAALRTSFREMLRKLERGEPLGPPQSAATPPAATPPSRAAERATP